MDEPAGHQLRGDSSKRIVYSRFRGTFFAARSSLSVKSARGLGTDSAIPEGEAVGIVRGWVRARGGGGCRGGYIFNYVKVYCCRMLK